LKDGDGLQNEVDTLQNDVDKYTKLNAALEEELANAKSDLKRERIESERKDASIKTLTKKFDDLEKSALETR
jgi:SMC interacting uncharacterized protein involved in chromosome segregation